jgi:hypothetical protein
MLILDDAALDALCQGVCRRNNKKRTQGPTSKKPPPGSGRRRLFRYALTRPTVVHAVKKQLAVTPAFEAIN